MTKAELRLRTKQALGNRTSGTLTDAWYDNRVLNGYRRLLMYQGPVQAENRQGGPRARVLRFPEHEDREMRTLDYATLTSNFVANQTGTLLVTDIFDRTNNMGLTLVGERDMLSRDPDETGPPKKWCPMGRGGLMGYLIWPMPGASADNVDIYEYIITAPTLATDADSPAIDSSWHMAIVYAAAAEGAALIDWPDKHQDMNAKFNAIVSEQVTLLERASFGGRAGSRRNVTVMGW